MIESPLSVATVVAAVTALAFWLDRHVAWLSRVGASLLVIVFGALLSNLGVVPARSPVYDMVTGPVTSLAVAWLLLSVHLDDLRRAGPRMLAAFGLAAGGTAAGAFVGALVFGAGFGGETWRLAGTFMGTYSGGSLNFVAVGRGLGLPDELFAGAAAADNLTTGLWLGACLLLPLWLRRWWPEGAAGPAAGGAARGDGPRRGPDGGPEPADHQDREAEEAETEGTPGGKPHHGHPFFTPAPVSVLRLSVVFAVGLVLLWCADAAAGLVPQVPEVLWLTTFALAAAHLPPFAKAEGAMALGNFALHLFFAVIGIYSRVGQILAVGASIFLFTLTVVGVHGLVVFGLGRLTRLDLGTLSVASQAAVGGPSTALAVAVSRGWPSLVLPGVAAGLLGYGAGNYLGFAVAHLTRALGI